MKKLLIAIGMLVLTGCQVNLTTRGYFYVESHSPRYLDNPQACYTVSLDLPHTVQISDCFIDPVAAKVLADKLNRDLDEHWRK